MIVHYSIKNITLDNENHHSLLFSMG